MKNAIKVSVALTLAASFNLPGARGAQEQLQMPASLEKRSLSCKPLFLAAKPEPAANEAAVPQSAGLAGAIASYRSHPDATTWQQVWKELHALLTMPQVMHASAGGILHANPALTDIGAKAVDAEFGSRVWAFPKITECQSVLVQYQIPSGPGTKKVIGRGKHRKVIIEPPPMTTRFQALNLPSTVLFKDAQILKSTARQIKSDVRALVLVGNDRIGGSIWISAFRISEGGLSEDTNALSLVPPYLVQNIAGNPGFAGNDLVLTLPGANASGPQSSGYKILLKFIDGKFSMEGQSADQGPSMVVMQFVQALEQNRPDMARVWLTDPKLISIPKYAGLLNRPADKPFKVMAMSAPLLVGARFRVITFDKTDLIVDVAKVKTQWAIKSLYMAPPDPLAQKLVGSAVTPPSDSAVPKAFGAKSP
jgi:hypothetical protein